MFRKPILSNWLNKSVRISVHTIFYINEIKHGYTGTQIYIFLENSDKTESKVEFIGGWFGCLWISWIFRVSEWYICRAHWLFFPQNEWEDEGETENTLGDIQY